MRTVLPMMTNNAKAKSVAMNAIIFVPKANMLDKRLAHSAFNKACSTPGSACSSSLKVASADASADLA